MTEQHERVLNKLRRVGSKIGKILSPAPDDTRIGGDVIEGTGVAPQPREEKEPEIPKAGKEE